MPQNEQLIFKDPQPKKPTGHIYARIWDKEVLIDPNTNEVFESGPNLAIGRKLGKVDSDRFYAVGPAMGDPNTRQMDSQRISYEFSSGDPEASEATRTPSPKPAPAAPAATKPKFNMGRAKTFTGEGGYKYAYDPETNVIAILESNGVKKATPVYVRPDGKFQDAHRAIMAEYHASMLPVAPVRKEPPVTVSPPPPPPPTTTPEPTEKPRRRGGILRSLLRSDANDIKSSDF